MRNDHLVFLREFFRSSKEVGSFLPSSRKLGEALSAAVPHRDKRKKSDKIRVLEVGPGVGVTSDRVVRRMGSQDEFHLVEPNGKLVEQIQRRTKRWKSHPECPTVFVHKGYVQDFKGQGKFDVVICGIPLNNFPVNIVKDFFQHFKGLLKPAGTFSYFEYLGVRRWNSLLFMNNDRSKRFKKLNQFFKDEVSPFIQEDIKVLFNIFPAVAHHLRFSADKRKK